MAINYIYSGEPINGSANDDFIVAIPFVGYTGTVNNTINGNDGDDFVLGDGMYFFDTNQLVTNGSIFSALSFENLNVWTTTENPLFADSSIPHATAIVETTIGQTEFFSVAVGAGQTMTVDIDFADLSPIGNGSDLIVEIVDAGGVVLASNDDSAVTNGGAGSFSNFDSFLTYTPSTAGTYYIKVHPFETANFTDNNTFMLNLSVTGHAVSADPGQGNDIIDGGNGNDSLFGQGGVDTITGGAGNDLIYGGSGNDQLIGGANLDKVYGGDGDDNLSITAMADLVAGEIYDGGADSDTLFVDSGSAGYSFDLSTVSLNGLEILSMGDPGIDQPSTVIVSSSQLAAGNFSTVNGVSFTDVSDTYEVHMDTNNLNLSVTTFNSFSSSLDQIVVVGSSGDDTIVGSSVHDVISGADGNDSIDGGTGIDVMQGGLGNDIYYVDNIADTTVEANGAGTDKVFSSVTYSIASQFIEQLQLTGSDNTNATGNVFNNIIIGNSGNNILNGGTGADIMQGGTGDDTYIVDNVGDTTFEANAGGTDKVFSSVTYSVATQFIEQIWLTGAANINATGNVLNNILIGNSGNNTLNGAAGIDNMQGGLGEDIYFVDNVGDVVVEASGAGTDKVFSSVTFSVASQFVEQLWLTGSDNVNATGNSLNNIIIGNAGNNVLTGGAGIDNMQGGLGNDSYFVDNVSDIVAEGGGAGTDTIYSTTSFVASVNVENLVLLGATNTNATGNSLANVLKGNTANNILDGQAGNDVLIGVSGADTAFYQTITGVDARGGNGSDTWSDFTLGDTTINSNADKINISSLLIGYAGDGSLAAVEPYLTVGISGSNTTVSIDRDGAGGAFSDTLLLTLTGINTDLSTLLNNHQIVV